MGAAILIVLAQLATVATPSTGATVPPTGAPLTLAAAVERARTTSPRRTGPAMVADGAREAVRTAGRLSNPLFDFRTENWVPAGGTAWPDRDVFAVITQPIELGGKRGLRRDLAVADSRLAGTALSTLERDLALDTVRAYIRALRARALTDTLTANRDGLATIVASVGRRVDEGYTAEADLLKFKTEAARVDGDIARGRLELERSLAALAIAIGAAEPLDAAQLVEPGALPVPQVDAAGIAASVARLPDVRAATAVADRAHLASAFERARRVPDAAVTTGYKRTAGFDTMVLGVSATLPLFDGNRSAIARATGIERGAAADRDALVRQLSTDAASIVRAAQTIAAQADRAPRDLLEPADAVRHAARAAFREGTADVLKLIDAERVYADVHRAVIDLRLDALQTILEARFALGEETIP